MTDSRSKKSGMGKRRRQPKELNVIYFFDSAKTRSLRIPVIALKAGVGLVAASAVWGLIAAVLLVIGWKREVQLEHLHSQTLATLFDYESRYDGVYEKAYSPATGFDSRQNVGDNPEALDSSGQPLAQKNAAPGGRVITPPSKNAAPKTPSAPIDGLGRAGEVAVATSAAKPNAKKEKSVDKSAKTSATNRPGDVTASVRKIKTIEVNRPRVKTNEDAVEVTFVINNLDRSSRAAGYVWAVVTFVADDGSIKYFPAPTKLQLDPSGKVIDPRRSQRFSVRNFKEKRLRFPIPDNFTGKLSEVRIGLLEEGGKTRMIRLRQSRAYSTKKKLRKAELEGTGDGSKTNQSGRQERASAEPIPAPPSPQDTEKL